MKKGFDYTGISTVFYCHNGKGKFLMALRNNNCRDEHDRWDVGAGGLDFGITPEDNVRKEVKEEYLADVKEIEFLGYRNVDSRIIDGKKTHWITLDFKVLIDEKNVGIGEPHKFDEIGWFTLDSIPKNIHSQLGTFLEKYKDKF